MSKPKKIVKTLPIIGYTKMEEDGRYVSICVNLSLCAQGRTVDESFQKLLDEVHIYLTHVAENHLDEWDKYTNRSAHPDILEEFDASLDLARRAIENVRNKDYQEYTGVYPFVHPVSTSYAQTGL